MKKGEKLEKLIKEKYVGWSMARFADHVGIKKTTLHDITKKESLDKVSIENIKTIATGLGMSIEELLFRLDSDAPISNRIDFKVKESREEYRVNPSQKNQYISDLNFYGDISAGIPSELQMIVQPDKIEFPKTLLGKYADRNDIYLLKVNGESMNTIIPNGSYVVCLPLKDYYELKDNDIVIYDYNNDGGMKRFRKTEDKVIFSPESTNKDYHDVIISSDALENVEIKAKVIFYVVNAD